MSHCFRARFRGGHRRMDVSDPEWVISQTDDVTVVIRTRDRSPINRADYLVLAGWGYATRTEAESEGIKWQAALQAAFQWLLEESISQAGRRTAKRLGEQKYAGLSATQFFTRCYGVRSLLAHGAVPRPTRDEVGSLAASLEHFVGHLISGPLLDAVSD